jgi:hypothetical protein
MRDVGTSPTGISPIPRKTFWLYKSAVYLKENVFGSDG